MSFASVLQFLADLSYIAVAGLSLQAWVHHRQPSHAWLAAAIGSIAVVAAGSLLLAAIPPSLAAVVGDAQLVAFMAGGYALLRFRGTFVPLRTPLHVSLVVILVIATGAGLLSAAALRPGTLKMAVTIFVVVAWGICVGEPIARFVVASRRRPAVQKARLRALALGYGAILAILLFSAAGGGGASQPVFQDAVYALAILAAAVLYVSFSPPRWLRRMWRESEEDAFRRAIRALLLFSPTRDALAQRGVEWATRLVGADAAFIADSDGRVMAAIGMGPDDPAGIAATIGTGDTILRLPRGEGGQVAVSVPLPLSTGPGKLVVISGPFTPFFGSDEIDVIREYATNVTAGLDRAVLTERIAALERTKTEFLNLASHELRGPITVIRGYLSMLEGGSLGEIPPGLLPVLPVLVQRTDDMSSLIDQMLDVARLEEGRLTLDTRLTDLRVVVQRAVDLVRPIAGPEHPLILDEPGIAVPAAVDPDRTATILGNLISNAIKYSPGGGEVRVRVAREGAAACVSVSDHGIGIDRAQMDRLFTRFGRIVTPVTSSIGGTGLGLYLSRELARLHGGNLTAESVPGRGSTFTLTLPAAEGSVPSP